MHPRCITVGVVVTVAGRIVTLQSFWNRFNNLSETDIFSLSNSQGGGEGSVGAWEGVGDGARWSGGGGTPDTYTKLTPSSVHINFYLPKSNRCQKPTKINYYQ